MTTPSSRKKSKMLSLRLRADEATALVEAADKQGISLSEFIRQSVTALVGRGPREMPCYHCNSCGATWAGEGGHSCSMGGEIVRTKSWARYVV